MSAPTKPPAGVISTLAIARPDAAARIAPFLLLLFAPGCVVSYSIPRGESTGTDKPVTHRHVVLGFGVIEVSAEPAAAIVQRSRTLGIQVVQQPAPKVTVGYATAQQVFVPEHADDVRLEARERDGVFSVTVDSAQLSPPAPANQK